jgi:hypothetical protein
VSTRRKEPERLPHGYTNATSLQSRQVVKRYLGPDAVMRRQDEIKALTFLAGRFPVPALLGQNESSIMLSLAMAIAHLGRADRPRCWPSAVGHWTS